MDTSLSMDDIEVIRTFFVLISVCIVVIAIIWDSMK